MAYIGSGTMASCLKRIGIGTFCAALAIGSTLIAASSSASARHLRAYTHGGHWGGRIISPPMIGGFAFGARTYTYYGYPTPYNEVVGHPALRVRY